MLNKPRSLDRPSYQLIWTVTVSAFCSGTEIIISMTTLYQLRCAHFRQCIECIHQTSIWWQMDMDTIQQWSFEMRYLVSNLADY